MTTFFDFWPYWSPLRVTLNISGRRQLSRAIRGNKTDTDTWRLDNILLTSSRQIILDFKKRQSLERTIDKEISNTNLTIKCMYCRFKAIFNIQSIMFYLFNKYLPGYALVIQDHTNWPIFLTLDHTELRFCRSWRLWYQPKGMLKSSRRTRIC